MIVLGLPRDSIGQYRYSVRDTYLISLPDRKSLGSLGFLTLSFRCSVEMNPIISANQHIRRPPQIQNLLSPR